MKRPTKNPTCRGRGGGRPGTEWRAGLAGAEHPDPARLAVDLRVERRLEPGEPLGLLAGEPAEVALAGEPPQLDRAGPRLRALGRGAELPAGVGRGQVGVALVDRLELEGRLQPGVVTVVLLVELGEEPVGLEAVLVGRGRHERVGYRPCTSSRSGRSGGRRSST